MKSILQVSQSMVGNPPSQQCPYSRPEVLKLPSLWEEALGLWTSSAAWCNLHGHLYLGRLAALNTLAEIRERNPSFTSRLSDDARIHATRSAIASEYYSIAKQLPSRRWKRRLFLRALENCNDSIAHAEIEISGKLAVRGHIKLQLGNTLGAISDFKEMLRLRQEAGDSPGRIGEALSSPWDRLHSNGGAFSLLNAI